MTKASLSRDSEELSLQHRLALAEEKNRDLVARIRSLSEETRSQQQLIRTLFDFTPFGLVVFNEHRQIVQINKAGLELLNSSRVSLIGRSCEKIFSCFDEHGECPVMSSGQSLDRDETHCPAIANNRHIFLRSAVLADSRSQIGVIEAFVDISQIKQAERAKNDFLAKMSHELRTPLNAIFGFISLLQEDMSEDPESTHKEYLEYMYHAGMDLEHIISELMDVARIRANKVNLDMHFVNVSDLVNQVVQEACRISDGECRLTFQISRGIETVYADPGRLKQILIHLISNAFKYAGDTSVQLQVHLAGSNIEFVVRDHGQGMSDEQLQRVFQEFEQADNSITREFGGVGLGLSIAFHLAQLMGGSLNIKSQLGDGTQVILTLPVIEAA